jgi:general secretion pathway protein E
MAIHELLVVDDQVRALVMDRADASAIRRYAISAGMTSMRDDGFAKAAAGMTTEAEVLRVAQGEG